MKSISKILLSSFLYYLTLSVYGQDIFRFERIGSEQGLSQNTAFSILFDSKGFMWIGTYNGLNRYDGYEFKIYRSNSENGSNFTNNRVIKLWEDKRGFIWLETYDGYYHFFNPEREVFTSLPFYEGSEVKNGAMNCFLQYSDDIIFLGSSVSGLYYLKYDQSGNTYRVKNYTDATENSLTNPSIRFIHKDAGTNLWIGTGNGINYTAAEDISKDNPSFIQQYIGTSFNCICETDKYLWFGTDNKGILTLEKKSHRAGHLNSDSIAHKGYESISHLYLTRNNMILAGFKGNGVIITDTSAVNWRKIKFHSRNLEAIYEDNKGDIWLTAKEFGATRIDTRNLKSEYYELTPVEIKPLTDLERPQFFEDSKGRLWIGLHGSGLALFNREKDQFEFYRNDPKDANTISSNFIHCIAEDKSGKLWIGTGQVVGGIEKAVFRNPAFEHYLPEKNSSDILDNVARAILEDNSKYLWIATKAGRLHLYDSLLKQIDVFLSLPGIGQGSFRNISYTLFQDNKGYLWIGSKGYGLAVSTKPLNKCGKDYRDIKFTRYEYSEDNDYSISNNNIYSICQDQSGNIWIGTYGNGLNLVVNPYSSNIKFHRINQQNSNISSNLLRHLMIDNSGNLWIATTFGLNLLEKKNIETSNFRFKVFLHSTSDEKSLIYNDIIHIFQDSRSNIWFGTYGGGADMLEKYDGEKSTFKHFGSEILPGYGIIFGILEDIKGNIWFSSENGLICLDSKTGSSEIYNNFNGLGFNNFSENTCFKRQDGSIIFGGNLGFEVIRPEKIVPLLPVTRVEFTKFLLFNREVSTYQKDSPLEKSISFSDKISLNHQQSSFSIDFSALDFLDPGKIEYSYRLDNFDRNWNNVGNQHRATYTNLSPGKYVFRVKTVQPNRNSNSNERVINIFIANPWWKTVPAYTFYSIILILIGISIYRTVTRINRYKNALIIEKKVNEYKLEFFTNISHEIRTPLTLIIGPLEDMLEESGISNKKRLQMEIMLKNARRMLHLTNQLLDFRKVQNNKMILKIKRIDIIAFTREIYNSFVPLANHKGIVCSLETQFDTYWLYADPNKLDTIIYNIISNALKFTDTGKKVSIKIEDSENSNSIDISVTDEGPGIPQKSLAELFTSYTILSDQDLSGTGIGLSLSYELAKLHKGNILVTSAVGKGSTFTIRLLKGYDHFLPGDGIENPESFDTGKHFEHLIEDFDDIDEDEIPDANISDKHVILVIEDNQEILNYICQSLKSFFICIGARNGNEGLQLAKSLNPDVIITDIMMPGMDGMEMTKLLKEDFSTSHIPVIILTAKSDLKDQIEGIATGAEAYIVKPFNMEYLKTVAGNLINQRSKVIARFIDKKKEGSFLSAINSKDEEFLVHLTTHIEENCYRDLSIDLLAAECNVSRTVFYNKIKGLTGSSPIDFVRKIKLRIAADLLKNGYNVSEVAFKTGFTDVKYFSRQFKNLFGYSPSKHK
jgi:signal transduction histidine kinase/ligand-binding sensor domain-containing protein/DNA-binding response OmpR family regulator